MTASRVVKLPRDDDESAHVLVQVVQKGSKPLDVKLVGTEGAAPYAATLKHDRVSSLRVANCPVSESEWQTILQSLFDLQPAGDIQATASIKSEASLSITVRKRVQGITQRLGSIDLKYNENEGIELFEWCADSIDALAQSKQALAEATTHATELESTVKELKAQLDELVTSKQEDETALLMKFRDLLNEKKVKIREQQKILATGSFQNSQPASQRAPQQVESGPSRAPAPSRPRKRKVESPRRDADEAEEDDEMELDNIKVEPQSSDREDTPEDTASTASEDEDEGDDPDNNAGSARSGGRSKPTPKAASKAAAKAPPKATPKAPPPSKKADEQPPAPRHLPFTRNAKAAPAKAPEADIETESDDEL
ncbi:Lif1p-like protein [Trichoderma parareesei]|uniref:Lif1p-like protein n=1 Tax=Trichoderma parareesei TaxID=858221 RepID=A0A2H2ZR71_TRIPA|nr:Lif1p-like protein [Trichoderma parareesei]